MSHISIGGFKIEPKPQRTKHTSPDEPCVENQSTSVVSHREKPSWFGELKTTNVAKQLSTYTYEDHTADVRLRARADDLTDLLIALGIGLVNYMTPVSGIEQVQCRNFTASGEDLNDLVFHWLDEILFLYGSEYFMTAAIKVDRVEAVDGSGVIKIRATCFGETFDRERHAQGTEVKAITMHDMIIDPFDSEGAIGIVLLDI